MSKDWSGEWQNSTNPGKQRKYRANAPHHKVKQFLSARVADDVRSKVGSKTLSVRAGDRVKVVRGDFSGKRGEVARVDTDDYKLYIEGVNRETVSGSETKVAIDPSNVVVTKLNLGDEERTAKFDLTASERKELSAEDAESEEESAEEAAEADEDEEAEDESADVDYTELVDENIDEVKDAIRSGDANPEEVLEAEKENKDRKTLVEWLENRIGGDTDE